MDKIIIKIENNKIMVSNNKIDSYLMKSWDFIGSILYENYWFKFASIIWLILNSLFLLLIYYFEFLEQIISNINISLFK